MNTRAIHCYVLSFLYSDHILHEDDVIESSEFKGNVSKKISIEVQDMYALYNIHVLKTYKF